MSSRISPNRRRSIAVLNQGGQASRRSSRRRAYSIAPGEKLSPAAKARRSLVPRKSILKARLPESNETSTLDDTTQSMELTQVHRPRPSLGRRVSFASHAHVRLIDPVAKKNGQGSSSQEQDSPDAGPSDAPNTRRRSSIQRRASVAFSEFGEQSMDMDMDETAPLPNDFMGPNQRQSEASGSGAMLDGFSDDDDDDEDMEVTEAIRMNIERKRSLSLGPGHPGLPFGRRSSVAPPLTSSQGQSENQPLIRQVRRQQDSHTREEEEEVASSDQEELSASTHSQSFESEGASAEQTQHMEFTIPISKSLRPPEPPSEAWLQLRAMTHSGDEPYEPPPPESSDDEGYRDDDAMEMTQAVGSVMHSRKSVAFAIPSDSVEPQQGVSDGDAFFTEQEPESYQDDSFVSTEYSFADDAASGDHTVNVTSLIRASLGTEGSSMDVIEEDERVVKVPIGTTVEQSNEATPATTSAHPSALEPPNPPAPQSTVFLASPSFRPPVFSAPAQKTPAAPPRSPSKIPQPATIPKPFTFSLSKPSSPSKTPATSSSTAVSARRGTAAFAPPSTRKSPLKRPAAPETDTAHPPSPAKRAAVNRLEPAKKAPFEKEKVKDKDNAPAQPAGNRRTSMMRRPSGYFAQRKSLGAGALPFVKGSKSPERPDSPKKAAGAGLGRGRASVGAAALGLALDGRQPSASSSVIAASGSESLYPNVAQIVREDPPTPSRTSSPAPDGTKECEREAFRQAIAIPSPTRGSPAPASPRVQSPALPRKSASPAVIAPQRVSPAPIPAPVPTPAPSLPEKDLRNTGIPLSQQSSSNDLMTVEGTASNPLEQWREGVGEDGPGSDDDGPTISIEQFFDMTGIKFMDELTMPVPGQSMVPPPKLRSRSRRRSSSASNDDTSDDFIPLAEFSVAMAVDLPRLELFTAVANDLSAWIEDSKKIFQQAERETEKVTPELFRDFVAADETEKELLVQQLKLIKQHNYGTARSQWYDWKMDWTERLYGRAEQEFANLESDAQELAKIIKQAQGILPDLREEYAKITAELAQEEIDIAELENSDQEYLNELKGTIAEQSTELEVFRTDVSEGRAKLERLDEKLAELESQREEAMAAIAQGQHLAHIHKESTSAEVFRLKNELEALEIIHQWHIKKFSPELVTMVYASRFEVSVPCIKYKPIHADISIRQTDASREKERDRFPRFTELAIQAGQYLVIEQKSTNIRQIVEPLSDFWSSCAQLRSQLTFLVIKYPLTVDAVATGEGELPELHITADVLFPTLKGKARISFMLDAPTYSHWPMSIRSLKTDVKVAFGPLEREKILKAVSDRLTQATPADSHGCLLDACIEATEQYA